jgi:CrcB protein
VTWLLVVAGGMVGAPLRYLTDRAVQARHDSVFPWGTLIVNAVGSLILGVVAGAVVHDAAPDSVRLFLGTGLCGALTTFSTFSYETLRLTESGSRLFALANVVTSVVVCVGAAFAGVALADGIWG